jgi:ABC-type phosphate transport system substrate-binding protein
MMRSWCLLPLVALLMSASPPVEAGGFMVVVHPKVEGTRISRSILAGIFQGEVIRWGNEARIRPVDQSSQSPVRREFIQDVLGQSLGELQNHWAQRMARHRQMPPPTKGSDEEVLAYVAARKGAIGYVSDTAELPPGVKVITVGD